MDYEKKYYEALERARELIAKWTGKNKDFYVEDYAYIFPELRESEDEKVRKCLIAMVNATIWDSSNLASKKACLAWLEKQKESLHIPETCKENAELFTSQCGDNRFELIDKAKRDIIAKTNIESSPDEMKVLYSFLFRAWQMGWLGKYDVIVPEQKPAEWSEDDKDYYDTIVRKLEVIGDDSGLSNNQIKFLREHCPSHRSEWSEEDEKMCRRIIDILNRTYSVFSAIGTSSTMASCPTYQNEIDWLKSLRPSWKPGEDQMAWLKLAIDEAKEPLKSQLEELYKNIRENLIWK